MNSWIHFCTLSLCILLRGNLEVLSYKVFFWKEVLNKCIIKLKKNRLNIRHFNIDKK